MSWLTRSFASQFQEESDDEDAEKHQGKMGTEKDQGRGMKEDLSELTRSFTKQLWGVASFLAPPPVTADNSAKSQAADSAAPGSNPERIAAKGNLQGEPVHRSKGDPYDLDNLVSAESRDNAQGLMGIRSDFAEISGSVRTGLSKISSNKAVHEISKLASNLLPFRRISEEEEDGEEDVELEEQADAGVFEEESLKSVVGVTDEVLTFARNISMHPETWLDFPLFNDEDDLDDFDMSDIQREHALAIERLAPRLAALRIELCPGYMSEGRFWKIYFVLLHSRLNKQDALLLTTPQIVEARGLLLQELQNRTKARPRNAGNDMAYSEEKSTLVPQEQTFSKQSSILDRNEKAESFKIVSLQAATPVAPKDFQTDDQTAVAPTQRGIFNDHVHSEEPLIQNKTVLSGTVKLSEYKYEDEAEVDDWLEEEPAGMDAPVCTTAGMENEEDVSFSDLEDEDEVNVQATSSSAKESFHSSSLGTVGWVQLDNSSNYMAKGSTSRNLSGEGASQSHTSMKSDAHMLHIRDASAEQQTKKSDNGESNDWLTVDEEDVVSADSS